MRIFKLAMLLLALSISTPAMGQDTGPSKHDKESISNSFKKLTHPTRGETSRLVPISATPICIPHFPVMHLASATN